MKRIEMKRVNDCFVATVDYQPGFFARMFGARPWVRDYCSEFGHFWYDNNGRQLFVSGSLDRRLSIFAKSMRRL